MGHSIHVDKIDLVCNTQLKLRVISFENKKFYFYYFLLATREAWGELACRSHDYCKLHLTIKSKLKKKLLRLFGHLGRGYKGSATGR
jgi:hypothetical protein